MPPNVYATGDIESMALLAGQSAGLVDKVRPAADILREAVNGAERLIRELSAKVDQNAGTHAPVPPTASLKKM
jgi:enoyl-[acyl-carrier protein] reductase II